MAIPPLVLQIIADSRGVKKGVGEAQAQVGGLKNSIARNSAAIKTALVAGVVGGIAVSIKAAADLGEAQNKANVIFGESVDAVNKFAETSADAFGIAKAEALEAASSFGAMFDSAGIVEAAASDMSVVMTKLAGDMASFNNADPSEMLEKLRSGLSGEAEPLRRFGVFISEARVEAEAFSSGIAKAGQELTDAQKIQARYNIILQDTKKQQGDFARTSNSLPNIIRRMRATLTDTAATIGQTLLPAVTKIVEGFNGLLKVIRPVAPALVVVAAGFAAIWTLGKLASMARSVFDTATAFGKFFLALGPLGGAAAAAAGSITLIGLAIHGANTELDDFEKHLTDLGIPLDIAKRETDALREAQARAGPTTRFMGRRTNELSTELQLQAVQYNGVTTETREYTGAVNGAAQADRNATQAAKDLRTARLQLAGGLLGLVTQLGSLRDAQRTVNELERNGKRGTEEYKDAKVTLLTEIVSSKQALQDYAGQLREEGATYPQVRAKLVDLGRQYGLTRKDVLDVLRVVEDTNAAWAKVPKKVRTTYTIDLTGDVNAANAAGFDFGQTGSASGGRLARGQASMVGEQGPELFIPSVSGTVVANQNIPTTEAPTVHVYIGDEEVERVVVKAVNRAASRA